MFNWGFGMKNQLKRLPRSNEERGYIETSSNDIKLEALRRENRRLDREVQNLLAIVKDFENNEGGAST